MDRDIDRLRDEKTDMGGEIKARRECIARGAYAFDRVPLFRYQRGRSATEVLDEGRGESGRVM